MKYKALIAVVLASVQSFAQITITQSDFPNGGDTAMVSITTDYDFDFAVSGDDYTWDYSALTMSTQRIDTFFAIEDASITYQLVFNDPWFEPDYEAEYYTHLLDFVLPDLDIIGVSIQNPVGFTKVESDRIEMVGVGLEIEGVEVPIKNEEIDVIYELPMNYGDDWLSNSFFEVDLNPAYDGILRRHQERNTQVDGWGTVITPFGTFDVLRTVSFIDFTDSLKVTIGGFDSWVELPTPNQIVYSWWADNQKIPVLEVVIQDMFGTETVSSVEYKDRLFVVDDSNVEENNAVSFKLYPNPTSNQVQIISKSIIDKIEIINSVGAVVENVNWNKQNKTINVSNLPKGTYFIQIYSDNAKAVKSLVIE